MTAKMQADFSNDPFNQLSPHLSNPHQSAPINLPNKTLKNALLNQQTIETNILMRRFSANTTCPSMVSAMSF
jgi:hypothetical protein